MKNNIIIRIESNINLISYIIIYISLLSLLFNYNKIITYKIIFYKKDNNNIFLYFWSSISIALLLLDSLLLEDCLFCEL